MDATTNLDRYQYVSPLGSGGMATVVLAQDTVLDRQVALKRMKVPDDTRGVSRLRREALIGASVSHPNLVSIYDVVTADDGDQVIVMEYVRGETLRDALFRERQLPPAAAMRILHGVSAALDAIHRQGIIHRDVKPANILLGTDDTVKLADLGIASVPDRTRITTDGALLGTFSYMAPEQLGGEPATPAVDVYALSAVAFEMLSGRKAHTEDNPVALAHAISTQPPPDLLDVWPEGPPAAAEVLVRGMSKDPERRPRSATELTARLHAALEPETTASHAGPSSGRAQPLRRGGQATTRAPDADARRPAARRRATPPPGPSRPRSRAGLFAAGLVALVALGVIAAVLLSGSRTNQPSAANSTGTSKPAAPPAHSASSASTRSSTGTTPAAATSASTPGSSTPATSSTPGAAASPARGSAASPVAAVESFYHLAAAHNYSQAWALADPTFQSQLGGYQSFQNSQAQDRSITFNDAHVVNQSSTAAAVAVQTTSVRSNGTQHCSGTVDLARTGATANWALHLIHINCA